MKFKVRDIVRMKSYPHDLWSITRVFKSAIDNNRIVCDLQSIRDNRRASRYADDLEKVSIDTALERIIYGVSGLTDEDLSKIRRRS